PPGPPPPPSPAPPRQRPQLAFLALGAPRGRAGEAMGGWARAHRGDRRSRAVEGDVHEVETKRQAERFAYEMAGLPDPGGRVAVLAGTGFDQRDQLIDRLRRQRGVYAERHHVGDGDRDGVEVLVGVVGDRAVEA